MKLLFFHRLDLVHLYAPVSKELNKEYEVIHVVYSSKELEILRKVYHITGEIYNVSTLRDDYYESLTVNDEKIIELDEFIIKNTKERFCLNSSIYLDRTYQNLSYKDSVFISLVYYNVWKHIFEETKPQLFFHEPPALMMTHLAAMFCKRDNAKYLTQIQVAGLRKFQWIFLEGDDAQFIEYDLRRSEPINSRQLNEAESYIETANKDFSVLLNDVVNSKKKNKKIKFIILIRGVLGSVLRSIKSKISKFDEINPKQHLDLFLTKNRKSFVVEIENLLGRLYESYYSKPAQDQYYFYPLHLEPEAVVLYYADGWYEGQLKLIENIAAQLPPNTYLYVKDHPHGGQYRDVRDYKRLLRIRNLKLIDPSVPGKQLIKDSLGVITINGTAGFEALLMNKRVFCFGKAFYTSFRGVVYINHIKELREKIYDSFNTPNTIDLRDIQMFLNCSHDGFVSYFSGRQNTIGIDIEKNNFMVAGSIRNLIDKFQYENPEIK